MPVPCSGHLRESMPGASVQPHSGGAGKRAATGLWRQQLKRPPVRPAVPAPRPALCAGSLAGLHRHAGSSSSSWGQGAAMHPLRALHGGGGEHALYHQRLQQLQAVCERHVACGGRSRCGRELGGWVGRGAGLGWGVWVGGWGIGSCVPACCGSRAEERVGWFELWHGESGQMPSAGLSCLGLALLMPGSRTKERTPYSGGHLRPWTPRTA